MDRTAVCARGVRRIRRQAISLAGVKIPSTLQVAGRTLDVVSCGVRDSLWIDHYAAALYVPRGASIHAVLVTLWLLGLVTNVLGAFIHILLVVALGAIIYQVVTGKRGTP